MIEVKSKLVLENINARLDEAKEFLSEVSADLSKAEILSMCENISGVYPEFAVALGCLNEGMPLNEFMVKHVSAAGTITKTKDKKTRQRQAFQTTGLSKSARRRIAMKAAKTKRANPSSQITAKRRKAKAMKKRAMLGLSNTSGG